jgi:cytochrome c5
VGEILANRARLVGSDRYKTARFAAIGATGIQLPTSTADAKPARPSVVHTTLYSGRCHLCHARDQIHEFGGPDVLRLAEVDEPHDWLSP